MRADVQIASADIADVARMRAVLSGVGGKLRGVVHAAGVGGIESLQGMTRESLSRVLRAKVQGSWGLHELTRGEELDFFVGFSSIASVWGSKGQAHYAAGNRFVDMLAQYRRRRGEVGLSVNWGPWSGGGMASEEAQGWLGRMGVGALEPELGLAALEQMLGSGEAQIAAAKVEWKQFKAVYELRGRRSLLEAIEGGEEVQQTSVTSSDLRQRLAEHENPIALLREHLKDEIRRVMHLGKSENVPLQQGFFEMGMDSIMAVELKNRLEASLSIRLPATVGLEYPTIESLSEYLYRILLPQVATLPESRESDAALAEIQNQSAETLEAFIDQELRGLIQ
jgi:acyl carrier protein